MVEEHALHHGPSHVHVSEGFIQRDIALKACVVAEPDEQHVYVYVVQGGGHVLAKHRIGGRVLCWGCGESKPLPNMIAELPEVPLLWGVRRDGLRLAKAV